MLKNFTKKQLVLFFAGLLAVLTGLSILVPYAYRRIRRELYKQKLLKECIVFEIPELHIKAPVLEGTDNEVLSVAAGHFPDTGAVGKGNYCLAGHSSTIYACIFDNLKNAESGMSMYLYDTNENCWTYTITESFIINPNDTWVLDDFGDDRMTVITCTDDGTQRQVVVGSLTEQTMTAERTLS